MLYIIPPFLHETGYPMLWDSKQSQSGFGGRFLEHGPVT